MKEQYYACNRINSIVDEFILTLAENYNQDWQQLSHKKYISLTRDRVLKQLKQLEKEWNEEE